MIVVLRRRTITRIMGGGLVLSVLCMGLLFRPTGDRPTLAGVQETERSPIVILDAGHGGEDGGAVSSGGVAESGINLQIARRLQAVLDFTGQQTRMTRENENAVYSPGAETLREKKVSDLKNRVAMVNDAEHAFLISIHQNSLPESRLVHGAQVFYNTQAGAAKTALSVQQALNRSVNPGNEKFAREIDKTIYLMKEIDKPGILVECGFLSNEGDARLLQMPVHQTRLGAAIAAGYLEQMTKEQGRSP